jgi:hypothetical protein
MTARIDEIRKRLEAEENEREGHAAFIEHAPEDMGYLLARVAKLEGLLRRTMKDPMGADALELAQEVSDALGEP